MSFGIVLFDSVAGSRTSLGAQALRVKKTQQIATDVPAVSGLRLLVS